MAVSDRLVDFSPPQITESNFPTLKKEEMREVVAEIDKSIPNEERVIALDRVLAHVDKSQILIADVPVRRPAASAGAILRGTRT